MWEPPASFARREIHDFFERVGEDEIVEVDCVHRSTMRTAMDSGLAEVDAFGAFGFELLVEDVSGFPTWHKVSYLEITHCATALRAQ